jgi:hypothetical protein
VGVYVCECGCGMNVYVCECVCVYIVGVCDCVCECVCVCKCMWGGRKAEEPLEAWPRGAAFVPLPAQVSGPSGSAVMLSLSAAFPLSTSQGHSPEELCHGSRR